MYESMYVYKCDIVYIFIYVCILKCIYHGYGDILFESMTPKLYTRFFLYLLDLLQVKAETKIKEKSSQVDEKHIDEGEPLILH